MKNTFGNNVAVTLFGESHGEAIGIVVDAFAPGIEIDEEFIKLQLERRRGERDISTQRSESDNYKIVSGVFEGKTTGTPVCIVIPNENTHSKDYSQMKNIARPGHADYAAYCKYHGFADYRGGGHFSGRITAPIVAAGAIALSALKRKKITVCTHVSECAGIKDRNFDNISEDSKKLSLMGFPVLDDEAKEKMRTAVSAAKADGDSVGGITETVITGILAGVGEPWFDSVESVLSHGLFSIPAVKGVEFGAGFALSLMKGSQANDSFRVCNGKVTTDSNHNGGINGGITNGCDIVFRCAVKPTPSIYKEQATVNFVENENTSLKITGRHDPAIIHRVPVVIDSITALVLCDLLTNRFGTDYLAN